MADTTWLINDGYPYFCEEDNEKTKGYGASVSAWKISYFRNDGYPYRYFDEDLGDELPNHYNTKIVMIKNGSVQPLHNLTKGGRT
jgi:hypothetical protein